MAKKSASAKGKAVAVDPIDAVVDETKQEQLLPEIDGAKVQVNNASLSEMKHACGQSLLSSHQSTMAHSIAQMIISKKSASRSLNNTRQGKLIPITPM